MTDFSEHVVGDVHNIVDRTDAHCVKSLSNLMFRGANLYVFHCASHISRTKCTVFHLNRHEVLNVAFNCFVGNFRLTASCFQCNCHFLCKFIDAVAVRTIGCDANVKDDVIKAKGFKCINAESCAFGETDYVIL